MLTIQNLKSLRPYLYYRVTDQPKIFLAYSTLEFFATSLKFPCHRVLSTHRGGHSRSLTLLAVEAHRISCGGSVFAADWHGVWILLSSWWELRLVSWFLISLIFKQSIYNFVTLSSAATLKALSAYYQPLFCNLKFFVSSGVVWLTILFLSQSKLVRPFSA